MIGSHNVIQPDANNELHAGPAIQDGSPPSHPAIATSADPSSYDPARAKGVEKARGYATGHGIRLAQTSQAISGSTGEKVALVSRRAARAARAASIDAYERGDEVVDVLAQRHNLTNRQFLVWVYDQRRRPYDPDKPKRPPGPKLPRIRRPDDGLMIGCGGKMLDAAVRKATIRLEERIVALQKKRGFAPFAYRTKIEVAI